MGRTMGASEKMETSTRPRTEWIEKTDVELVSV